MSRAEVEQILGAPRSTRDYGWATFYLYRGDVSQASPWQIQTGLVQFKLSGQVESVVTGEDARWPLLEKIRSWDSMTAQKLSALSTWRTARRRSDAVSSR